MNPSWDDAPQGANWLTGDGIGYCFWEKEPSKATFGKYYSIWYPANGGMMWNIEGKYSSDVFKETRP